MLQSSSTITYLERFKKRNYLIKSKNRNMDRIYNAEDILCPRLRGSAIAFGKKSLHVKEIIMNHHAKNIMGYVEILDHQCENECCIAVFYVLPHTQSRRMAQK